MECTTKKQSVAVTYNERKSINFDPFYQVDSCRWKLLQKQMFIQSLIKGFDTPKIYLHDVRDVGWDNEGYTYALVDGKQRLQESVIAFMNDEFTLAKDFKYGKDSIGYTFMDEVDYPVAGMKYSEMSRNFKDYFRDVTFDMVYIVESNITILLEMFVCLQNGTTLNPMEVRNASFNQPYLNLARTLSKHDFFQTVVSFKPNRAKHLEAALRFLNLDYMKTTHGYDVCGLESRDLDRLLVLNDGITDAEIKKIENRLYAQLNNYMTVCKSTDLKIKSGTIMPYFVFINRVIDRYTCKTQDKFSLIGSFLEKFENLLAAYRLDKTASYDNEYLRNSLHLYDIKSSNGTQKLPSLKDRIDILYNMFELEFGHIMVELDSTRNFSSEMREYIWRKNNKKCQVCNTTITLEEMDADHREPWSKGGKTTLDNARCLCVSCNRSNKKAA
tara:strand:+ start:1956 stop:3281 length:1326 start_codon:yes stop_codon:yes gene_type:complete